MNRVVAALALAGLAAFAAVLSRPAAGTTQQSVVRLSSPRDCAPGIAVNFDDLPADTPVAERYAARGVHFVDDNLTTPLIYANSERTTSSPPNSVTNDADFPNTSAGVPLTLLFDDPQTHAGFFIGNGAPSSPPLAVLTAYDASGAQLGQVSTPVTSNDLVQFFGIFVTSGGIRKVTLDYGPTARSEEIDDLCFAARAVRQPPPAVQVEPYVLARTGLTAITRIPRDVSIHGIEITQGIQCFNTAAGLATCPDNSLSVVTRKTTAARIYLKYTSLLGTSLSNVPVRLHIRAAGVWYTADTTGTAKATLGQTAADDSTNVFFIVNFVNDVLVDFFAEVDPDDTIAESNEANNRYPASGLITLNFRKRATLPTVGQRVRYHPTGYTGTEFAGGWAVTGGAADWFEQLLPVRNDGVPYSLKSGFLDWTTTLGTSGQHSLIGTLNFMWVLENLLAPWLGTGAFTGARHVYGWTPSAGFSGGHADMPVYPHAGGLGVVGIGSDAPGTSSDNPGSGALIFGHELIHDYDVKHTNTADGCLSSDSTTDFPYTSSSIQEVGFNPLTGRIYDPAATHDVMSYCPSQGTTLGWIAPFTWTKMFNNLVPGPSTSSLAGSFFQTAAESLVVNATLFLDGGGTLGDLYRVPVAATLPPPPEGAYAIELRGPEGEVLHRQPFAVDFRGEYSEGEFSGLQPKATLSFALDWRPGTASVALMQGDKVLDERRVSANPPAVEITAPSEPASWPAGSTQALAWGGSDPDGDPLSYSVLYSHDGGSSWQLLATGLEGQSLEVNVDAMAGGRDTRFFVVATDGLNAARSEPSVPIEIPNKPPVPTILNPPDGLRVPAGSLVVLRGGATDLEDGSVPEERLAWSSSVGGDLGAGAVVPLRLLAPGVYEIRLTARDRNGATGTVEVTVLVSSVGTPTVTPAVSTVGEPVVAQADFSGAGGAGGLSCAVDYGDGSGEVAGAVSGGSCAGPPHVYLDEGEYPVVVAVRDDAGEIGSGATIHVVEGAEPTRAFLTGGGWVASAAGSCTLTSACESAGGKASFGLVARYHKGAATPSGETTVSFPAARLTFRSSSYDWLVVRGATARYKGTGTINRAGTYGFLVTVFDGGVVGLRHGDGFRIKIWDRLSGRVVYDSERGSPDAAPPAKLGGGSIVLHKAG